jgi:uncharacterized protein (TIGR02246 family)
MEILRYRPRTEVFAMRPRRVWLCAIAATFLTVVSTGCVKASHAAQPDTRATDDQTIRESEIAWARAYATKDVDRIVEQYAVDGSSIVPGLPMATGRKAIRAAVVEQLADPRFALSFRTAKVQVSKSGDMAYSQGVFTFTGTDPKTKKATVSNGHYVEVYAKQADGSWKVVEDIAANEGPATTATSTQ